MGLDGVLTQHHSHRIVDVRRRDVAVHVDFTQSLNKSLFGTVGHRASEMVLDPPPCKYGRRTPDDTTLAERRSVTTPIRMTIPPASSLTRNLCPGSSNVL